MSVTELATDWSPVDSVHAAAGGGAAVLRILREGHHVLHPVILELLKRLLGQGVGVPVQCITLQYSTVQVYTVYRPEGHVRLVRS